jgi:hypothetical protein
VKAELSNILTPRSESPSVATVHGLSASCNATFIGNSFQNTLAGEAVRCWANSALLEGLLQAFAGSCTTVWLRPEWLSRCSEIARWTTWKSGLEEEIFLFSKKMQTFWTSYQVGTGGKGAKAWSWKLAFVYCQSYEYMEVYLHFSVGHYGVVLYGGAHTTSYLTVVVCLATASRKTLARLSDPWRLDRYIVPKRR